MLDGIDPWGLTGPDGLNSVAATFFGAAIILLAIGCVVGLIRWIGGKASSSSESARKGLRMAAAGVLGAVVLGSIGGAVQWGSSLGTASLMPEAARPGMVVIDRQSPKTTCTEQAVRNFADETEPLTREDRVRFALEVTRGNDADGLLLPGTNLFGTEQRYSEVISLKWYPTGTDCSTTNIVAADCTNVEVSYYGSAGNERRDQRSTKSVPVGQDCPA